MERFYSKLSYRHVQLWTPADISQFSFIVQKSVCYLNLQVCQSCALYNVDAYVDCPSYSYSKDYINTEEKCRKVFSKSRRLLYILNLDLPIGREWSLKSASQPENVNVHFINPHIAKITINACFYSDAIYSFIDDLCRHNGLNLKILKWLVNLDVLVTDTFYILPPHIVSCIIECIHLELDDLEFVWECLTKFNLLYWTAKSKFLNPETITNLFYLFHRIGRNIGPVLTEELIDFLFSIPSLHLVAEVLKLKNAPSFSDDMTNFLSGEILLKRGSTISVEMAMTMSHQRHALLLQVFWIYLNNVGNLEAASEFLRFIWSSVPDSLLSSDEITSAFAEGFSPEEKEDVCIFYSEAVGGLPACVEPRPLQQHCRTTIRRILHEKGFWLPEGINEIFLPKRLKYYLNLEA